MLKTNEVSICCKKNNKNRKYFEDKGYTWDFEGCITVRIFDLPPQSNIEVEVQCDYCLEEGLVTYKYPSYAEYKNSRNIIAKDACKNCSHKKMMDVNIHLYGVPYPMQRKEVAAKFKKDFYEVKEAFAKCGYTLRTNNPESYINADTPLEYYCENHPNEIQTTIYRTIQQNGSACQYCGNEAKIKRGKESHLWKGGIVNISAYLRERIKPWKDATRKAWGRKCVLSDDDKNIEVHHLSRNFNASVKETFESLCLPILESVNQYSELDLRNLEKRCLELHFHYGLGICLARKVHKEYHNIYGKEDGNIETFIEFAQKYYGKQGVIKGLVEFTLQTDLEVRGKYYLPKKNATSRFFGVSLNKKTQKWGFFIYHLGKVYRQQGFNTEVEAAYAFNNKVKSVKGKNGSVNLLTEEEEAFAENCKTKVKIPKTIIKKTKQGVFKNERDKLTHFPWKEKTGFSRFTNVYQDKRKRWGYSFTYKEKIYSKVGFMTDVEAAFAYNIRVKHVKGDMAILNQLTSEEEREMEFLFANKKDLLDEKRKPTSQYHGVILERRTGKWLFQIKHKRKGYRVRGGNTEIEAAYAYNLKAREIKGDKAILNVLDIVDLTHVNLDELYLGTKEINFTY
ncbi:hypothetical protein [Bacillus cereus]|uniref:hypothetical protein n=1 Tax=Bacillus cereus TaxID=1396 RepID=UPI000952E6A6|nr:hypothetical protein [Bacillus cereus]OLR24937.1 hypothetical protein BLD50_15070 [Bacillus cereus]